jgi:hypothetical protein
MSLFFAKKPAPSSQKKPANNLKKMLKRVDAQVANMLNHITRQG